MRACTSLVALCQRLDSAVIISITCRRRLSKDDSSRANSSGTARGMGRTAERLWANTLASMASVLASLPVALAKSPA